VPDIQDMHERAWQSVLRKEEKIFLEINKSRERNSTNASTKYMWIGNTMLGNA